MVAAGDPQPREGEHSPAHGRNSSLHSRHSSGTGTGAQRAWVALALAAAASVAAAAVFPTVSCSNGHFYRVSDQDRYYADAVSAAGNEDAVRGVRGHLATVTSATENACVYDALKVLC